MAKIRHIIYGALAACLVTASCATTSQTHLTEGKAIADAWAAFDAASQTADALAKAGRLNAADEHTIAVDGAKIRDSLNAATTAWDNNQDATAAENVSTVTTLIAAIVAIVGPTGSAATNSVGG